MAKPKTKLMTLDEIRIALDEPLSSQVVSKRKGGKDKNGNDIWLDYVEGWHVRAELNRIFGFENVNIITDTKLLTAQTVLKDKTDKYGNKIGEYPQHQVTYSAKARLEITIGDKVVFKEGTGHGHGQDNNSMGAAHESAEKEAETDALKRAATNFGWTFGLALYDKKREHVTSDPPAYKIPADLVTTPSPQSKPFWERENLSIPDNNQSPERILSGIGGAPDPSRLRLFYEHNQDLIDKISKKEGHEGYADKVLDEFEKAINRLTKKD